MNRLSITDLDLYQKKVILRVDFNVPLNDHGQIEDDNRIRAALPTIRYVLDHGGSLIILSHLGRPQGRVVESLRLDPIAKHLARLLGREVIKVADLVGPEAVAAAAALAPGAIMMCENVRFEPGETKNDPALSRKIAALGDIFINDAFATAHRAQCSTSGLAEFMAQSAAGFLMKKELAFLVHAVATPERPFVVVLGGSKVSSKITVIKHLLTKVDSLVIGGGMAYTLLHTLGHEIGDSLFEPEMVETAREVLSLAEKAGVEIYLPLDHVVSTSFDPATPTETTPGVDIPAGALGGDIGPRTVAAYLEVIKGAKTVVWNGPMGVFEQERFANGTFTLARTINELLGVVTIIGGGDSVSAVHQCGAYDKVSHISTGGGASLELLEGRELPGIAALSAGK